VNPFCHQKGAKFPTIFSIEVGCFGIKWIRMKEGIKQRDSYILPSVYNPSRYASINGSAVGFAGYLYNRFVF
jgi:hypothetical protein